MVDWINISSNSGNGNATITVTASSYTELLDRSTSLTVRTSTRSAVVGITQRFNNDFVVSPTTITAIPYSGEVYSITVTAISNWSAGTTPAWCTLNANSGSSGTTTLTLTVDSNSGSARNGSITFTCGNYTRTVTLAQVAYEEPVIWVTIEPDVLSWPSSGGYQTLRVRSNGSWTLTYPDWIVPSQVSGYGDDWVNINTGSNTGNTRVGSVVATTTNDSATCTITQEGHYVAESGSISPSSLSFATPSSSDTIYVTANVSWYLRIATLDNYITLDRYNGMSGSSIPVTVYMSQNTGSARTTTISLYSSANDNLLDSITVSQAAYTVPTSAMNVFNVARFDWCDMQSGDSKTVGFVYTGNTTPTITRLGFEQSADAHGELTTSISNNTIYVTTTLIPNDTVRLLYQDVYEVRFNLNEVAYIFVATGGFSCCPESSSYRLQYYVGSPSSYSFGVPLFNIHPSYIVSMSIDNNVIDFPADNNVEIFANDATDIEIEYYLSEGYHTVEVEFTKGTPVFDNTMPLTSARVFQDSLNYFSRSADFTDVGVTPYYWEVRSGNTSGCNTVWQGATFESGVTALGANLFADTNTYGGLHSITFKRQQEPQLLGNLAIPAGNPDNPSVLHLPSGSSYTNVIAQLPSYWNVVYDA